MGAARVEIFARDSKNRLFPGAISQGQGVPVQVATETTSTSATTAGSRIVALNTSGKRDLVASCVVDEDCYVSIGADPTAAAATSWLLKANVAREIPIRATEKISFKDVA